MVCREMGLMCPEPIAEAEWQNWASMRWEGNLPRVSPCHSLDSGRALAARAPIDRSYVERAVAGGSMSRLCCRLVLIG